MQAHYWPSFIGLIKHPLSANFAVSFRNFNCIRNSHTHTHSYIRYIYPYEYCLSSLIYLHDLFVRSRVYRALGRGCRSCYMHTHTCIRAHTMLYTFSVYIASCLNTSRQCLFDDLKQSMRFLAQMCQTRTFNLYLVDRLHTSNDSTSLPAWHPSVAGFRLYMGFRASCTFLTPTKKIRKSK